MADRSGDWFRQGEHDLELAQEAQRLGRHEWACFASHQAAEKAVQALHLKLGQEAWGHVVAKLLQELPEPLQSEQGLDHARSIIEFVRPQMA